MTVCSRKRGYPLFLNHFKIELQWISMASSTGRIDDHPDPVKFRHLNPVRAKVVAHPGDYLESSYRAYIFKKKDDLVCRDLIWDMMSNDPKEAAKEYEKFVK